MAEQNIYVTKLELVNEMPNADRYDFIPGRNVHNVYECLIFCTRFFVSIDTQTHHHRHIIAADKCQRQLMSGYHQEYHC